MISNNLKNKSVPENFLARCSLLFITVSIIVLQGTKQYCIIMKNIEDMMILIIITANFAIAISIQ